MYFSKGLTTAIVDYSLVSLDDFNASQAAINLKSMADYQTLNLTRAYYNSYVKGNALTTVFTTKKDGAFPKPDANYNNYVASVNAVSLDATFTNALPQKMQVIENDASLKEQFYNQSIAMSNIQMIMDNDLSVYQLALNEVTYLDKKADPNATDYEKFCVQMIENHNYIVQQYNSVLENLINIIKNAEV